MLDNYKYLGPIPIVGEPSQDLYGSVAIGIADALGVKRRDVYVESITYEVKSNNPGGSGRRRLQTVSLVVSFYVFVEEGGSKEEMASLIEDKVYDGTMTEFIAEIDEDLQSVEVNEDSLEVEGGRREWRKKVGKWWELAKEHWIAIGFGVAVGGTVFGGMIYRYTRVKRGDQEKLILEGRMGGSTDINNINLGAIYGKDNGML